MWGEKAEIISIIKVIAFPMRGSECIFQNYIARGEEDVGSQCVHFTEIGQKVKKGKRSIFCWLENAGCLLLSLLDYA